jgi:hypothetical protein
MADAAAGITTHAGAGTRGGVTGAGVAVIIGAGIAADAFTVVAIGAVVIGEIDRD